MKSPLGHRNEGSVKILLREIEYSKKRKAKNTEKIIFLTNRICLNFAASERARLRTSKTKNKTRNIEKR